MYNIDIGHLSHFPHPFRACKKYLKLVKYLPLITWQRLHNLSLLYHKICIHYSFNSCLQSADCKKKNFKKDG